MEEPSKPSLIFYGNCQANALSWLMKSDALINGAFDVQYLASFDDRIPGTREIDPQAVADAAILFEQFDPVPFPFRSELPSGCVRVTFPSVDLNLLWPLHAKNAYNDPSTPEHLWGHFPYGDRVIIDAVTRGESLESIVEAYPSASAAALPNLQRFARLEWARLAARDAKCDVKMADFVMEELGKRHLFWCINHPGMSALSELALRLIAVACDAGAAISPETLDTTVAALPPQGPLGFYSVPIHPLVAEHLGLRWIPGPDEAVYGLRDEPLTYSAYFRLMTEYAIGVREAQQTAAPR